MFTYDTAGTVEESMLGLLAIVAVTYVAICLAILAVCVIARRDISDHLFIGKQSPYSESR